MDEAEDPKRTEQILERLHPSCFGWALLYCRWDREMAQDVLQTAYLKILDGEARLNGQPDPRPWVFGVIRKTASEQRRGYLGRLFGTRAWLEKRVEPPPQDTPEELATAHEERRRLRLLLDRLSDRQRSLLHLVFYEEMTIEEASSVLGVSVGTGRRHYERGKARLRKLLIDQQVSSDDRQG